MPTNGFNQSGFGGSQGTATDTSLQMPGQQPKQRQRPRFQTAQPQQPQAPQPAPTFAQMQQQGMARPNPAPAPQPTAQPQQQGGSVGGDLQQRVQQALASPSRYDLPQVQQVRQALQGDLNQTYDYQKKQLNEELAKRGLSESSIAGQRYSDLGSEQARALANIDAQLLQNYAATSAQDLSASLGAGQNYENSLQSRGLAERQLDQGAKEFDLQHALQEKLGLGGLGLQEKQLAQSGSQFDRSLAQSGQQFNLEHELSKMLGLGGLDLQKAQLAQSGSQFDKSLGLQEKSLAQSGDQFNLQHALQQQLGLGNLDLQKQSLAQSGGQFEKQYALQQAAQALNEKVQMGQMSRQDAELELQKLQQAQSYELGKSSQDIQRESLKQSGDMGKQNLLLQFLNSVGAEDQPDLSAEIAKLLGIDYKPTQAQIDAKKADDTAKEDAAKQASIEKYKAEYEAKYGIWWFQHLKNDHPELF